MSESDQDEATTSEAKQDPADASTSEQKADPFTEVLAQITNTEGKQKYADTLTALESIKPKEDMISTLKNEVAEAKLKALELEEELGKRSSAEELVNKVMENQNNQQSTDIPSGAPAENEIDIGELVRREIAGLESAKTKETNRATVAGALATQYGEKANEVLTNKMAELGLSPEFFKGVIEQSPAAALELLGASTAVKKVAPVKPHGSVRTESFSEAAPSEHSSVILEDSKTQAALWDKLMNEAVA